VAEAQFSFGVKAGVNQNSVRGDKDPFSYKPSTGFHLGVYGSIPLSNKLSLNPELQYIKKQLSDDYFRLNYLELPVLFNYQVSNHFEFELGPSIGKEIYAKPYLPWWRSIAFKSYKEALDLGLIGGVKFKASDKISIVARYNYSFLPFVDYNFNNGPGTQIEQYELYNSSVQLSVMYKIK
jgi:hypothetical protein